MNLHHKDIGYLVFLAVLYLLIWLSDLSWSGDLLNVVPALLALPIMIWLADLKLGSIWKTSTEWHGLLTMPMALGAFFMLLGSASYMLVLLSIGWTCFVYGWMAKKVVNGAEFYIQKLMIFSLLSFPWIAAEGSFIGWFFRLSGAAASEWFFRVLEYNTFREGVILFVNDLPIEVELACAGLNTLQTMLIAGSIIAFSYLASFQTYWLSLVLIFFFAWLANTVRIFVLGSAALLIGTEMLYSFFHEVSGWIVILAVFGLYWVIVATMQKLSLKEHF